MRSKSRCYLRLSCVASNRRSNWWVFGFTHGSLPLWRGTSTLKTRGTFFPAAGHRNTTQIRRFYMIILIVFIFRFIRGFFFSFFHDLGDLSRGVCLCPVWFLAVLLCRRLRQFD